MKKIFIFISIILVIVLIVLTFYLNFLKSDKRATAKFNENFEMYKDRTLFGGEVATAINKAIENNIKNNISKDQNEYYVDDGKNSIKVDVTFIRGVKEDGTYETVTYAMETINKLGTEEFLANYGLILFKCSDIQYHKETGRVSKIVFEETR